MKEDAARECDVLIVTIYMHLMNGGWQEFGQRAERLRHLPFAVRFEPFAKCYREQNSASNFEIDMPFTDKDVVGRVSE